jgi:Leucine-rich repeat (LRR) protein
LAGGFFSEKELIVLTRLFSDMRAASAKLSPDHRDRVPTKATFETSCQTNSLDGWSELASVVRKTALAFQCDPMVQSVFRLAFTDFLHPVLAKINQDNDIPVFSLALDDLLPPRDEAREYELALKVMEADIARFERENAALLAENKALSNEIEALKIALTETLKGTRSFISIFSNNKYWSDNKDSPFSVSLGDGFFEALIGLLHFKEIRDALGNGVRRTVSSGKVFFSRLGKWAEAHAINSIEHGAAHRIQAIGRLEAQLALPAPDESLLGDIRDAPPADLDMAEVHSLIQSGGSPPMAWRPFISTLNFDGNKSFDDLSPLSDLKALKLLNLDDTAARDLSPLSSSVSLRRLSLNNSSVGDLWPLAELGSLKGLFLNSTLLRDLSPLAGLVSLEGLFFDFTQVSDLSPVSRLVALKRLSFDNTLVSDLSPLSDMAALRRLSFDCTRVDDLSPVRNLSALTYLYLCGTKVSDLSPLSGLNALKDLFIGRTEVSDLSVLSGLGSLSRLCLEYTPVSDLSPLSGLDCLDELYLAKDQDLDVSVLDHLEHLTIEGGPAPREGRPRRR